MWHVQKIKSTFKLLQGRQPWNNSFFASHLFETHLLNNIYGFPEGTKAIFCFLVTIWVNHYRNGKCISVLLYLNRIISIQLLWLLIISHLLNYAFDSSEIYKCNLFPQGLHMAWWRVVRRCFFLLLLGLGCRSTSVCLKIFSVQFLVPSARVIRFSKWGSSSVFSAWPSFSSVNWETKSGSWVYNTGTSITVNKMHTQFLIYSIYLCKWIKE